MDTSYKTLIKSSPITKYKYKIVAQDDDNTKLYNKHNIHNEQRKKSDKKGKKETEEKRSTKRKIFLLDWSWIEYKK